MARSAVPIILVLALIWALLGKRVCCGDAITNMPTVNAPIMRALINMAPNCCSLLDQRVTKSRVVTPSTSHWPLVRANGFSDTAMVMLAFE